MTKGWFPQLTKAVCMSNHNHLRLVTLPPALASVTICGLLPSFLYCNLLLPLPNKWCCQTLHMCQLLGGMGQLQPPLAYYLGDPDGICLGVELLQLCIDTGQVVIQFAVVCDIHSNTPVIKSVGRFGEVSVNSWGTNEYLMEPGRDGFSGLG